MRFSTILLCLLALPALADDVVLLDSNNKVIGDALTVDVVNGVGRMNGISDGRHSTNLPPGTPPWGAFRFHATQDRLWHWAPVYFEGLNCDEYQRFYFFIGYNAPFNGNVSAERRRAMNDFSEWSLALTPPQVVPTVQSRVLPWQACENITPQALPGNLADYSWAGIRVRTYLPPYHTD